jgi:hypothetical protein
LISPAFSSRVSFNKRAFWIALALLLTAAQSYGQEKSWAWFGAFSLTNKWAIMNGKAELKILENRITGDLYDGDKLVFKLEGEIDNEQVTATAVWQFAEYDLGARSLKGKYQKFKTHTGTMKEAILLIEPDAPGAVTIGLTRTAE